MEKFQAENRKKRNFPVLETLREPKRFLPEIPHSFYILRLGRLDPEGWEIAKYGVFRLFWPRTAFGTYIEILG